MAPQSTNRRTFLKSTMAAVAAPMIVPSSVLGLGDSTAPSERVTLGAIGVGNRGRSNLGHFHEEKRTQVVAVCDVDQNHRESARKMTGLEQDASYNHFMDVINRDDIDAVSIASPDHWHVIHTIEAAKSGKDIFCEKPASVCIAEGRKMADAVTKYDRVMQMGTWRRSLAGCRTACELVRNGYIGELQTIECGVPEGYHVKGDFKPGHPVEPVPKELDYDLWLGPAPDAPYTPGRCHFNFRWLLDYSAGYITDWGAHYYDIGQWGNNTDHTGPVHISGAAEFPKSGLYDASVKHLIEYEYASGVRMVAFSSSDGSRYGMKFIGTEGWIHVESNDISSGPEGIAKIELKDTDTRLYTSDNHIVNFIDCVYSRGETAAPMESGHRTATICHLGHIATTLKRPLEWDPENEKFVGDREANALRERPMRGTWTI